MNEIEMMRMSLKALVVFRGVCKDDVIAKFGAMLGAETAEARVEAYAAFAAALFAHGENWTDYLLARVLEDENTYAICRAQGKPETGNMRECVCEELKALQALGGLKSADVKAWIGFDGFLPGWRTANTDFIAEYMAHMEGAGKRGYGVFARHHMFSLENGEIVPIRFTDPITLAGLKGYEAPRQKVVDNTLALLAGKPAADALLYGDAGTGKSSTIKAIVNDYRDDGLRLIEVKKRQLNDIPRVVEMLSGNPLKFILFIDDLSFVQENDEYNALKAMLQGSAFAKTQNIVIYATSNRRHLVKETFSDRSGDDVHRNETIQELISLSQRFGLSVGFFKPGKKQYLEIVHALKDEYGIVMDDAALDIEAERFASMGRTPRAARQLMEHLKRQQT